ncbi:hypothetical protein P154DRAFT_558351, partial [Amniculicola lignicola CBS 123094]
MRHRAGLASEQGSGDQVSSPCERDHPGCAAIDLSCLKRFSLRCFPQLQYCIACLVMGPLEATAIPQFDSFTIVISFGLACPDLRFKPRGVIPLPLFATVNEPSRPNGLHHQQQGSRDNCKQTATPRFHTPPPHLTKHHQPLLRTMAFTPADVSQRLQNLQNYPTLERAAQQNQASSDLPFRRQYGDSVVIQTTILGDHGQSSRRRHAPQPLLLYPSANTTGVVRPQLGSPFHTPTEVSARRDSRVHRQHQNIAGSPVERIPAPTAYQAALAQPPACQSYNLLPLNVWVPNSTTTYQRPQQPFADPFVAPPQGERQRAASR